MHKPRSARALALAALREWCTGAQFADGILHRLLHDCDLTPQDRAFVTELFYGVLRNLRLLDFWIAQLRAGKLDESTRDIVRIGLLQLLLLGVPAHAAIFETVALAPSRARPLVNGMLRSAQRRMSQLRSLAAEQLVAVRMSHPDFLVAHWQSRFGEPATVALCEWNNRPPPTFVRVNELKLSAQQFVNDHPDARATSHPLFFECERLPLAALERGECYAQDPSTVLACELLDPQPNDRVLDACAAPGGKTSYIAQLMRNNGDVVAGDREEQRLLLLRENLTRLGVTCAQCERIDWTLEQSRDERYDRILVDAPCSNTGVMRRRVDVRWRLTPTDFTKMQRQQLAIASRAVALLKPGGVLVYSTCSIEPEENEAVVEQLLVRFPQLKLERTATKLPMRDGVDGAFAARLVAT